MFLPNNYRLKTWFVLLKSCFKSFRQPALLVSAASVEMFLSCSAFSTSAHTQASRRLRHSAVTVAMTPNHAAAQKWMRQHVHRPSTGVRPAALTCSQMSATVGGGVKAWAHRLRHPCSLAHEGTGTRSQCQPVDARRAEFGFDHLFESPGRCRCSFLSLSWFSPLCPLLIPGMRKHHQKVFM